MFFIIFMTITYGIMVGISYLLIKQFVLKANVKSNKGFSNIGKVKQLRNFINVNTGKRLKFASGVMGVYLITILYAIILIIASQSIGYSIIIIILLIFLINFVYKRLLDAILYKIENGEIDL